MSDQELLDHAEFMFGQGDNAEINGDAQLAYIQSMAASLLVIARNSIPVDVDVAAPVQVDLTKEQWIAKRMQEYSHCWNPITGRFEIEEDWMPTSLELYEDLVKGWKFEQEEK